MTPARRARVTNAGRWACALGAVFFAVVSITSVWCWLQGVGTVAGRRVSAGVDRGCVFLFVSKDWPERTPRPAWYFVAKPRLDYAYDWWGWFWPWRPLTSGGAWFRQLAFPSWLPVPILVVSGGFLWRAHKRARRDLLEKCGHCGYERDGLTAGAKCPECGAAAR